MKTILILIAATHIYFNWIVAYVLTTKQMKERYIDGQNTVGMIATNLFYLPAWIMKGLKFAICKIIR